MTEPDTVLAIWKARIAAARSLLGDMTLLPPHLALPQRAAVEHFFDEVELLAEESEDDAALRSRLAALLTGVANGLKGPPPPLTQWDWSDLPERAEVMRDRIAELEAVWQDPARLHANLLKSGYPRDLALHLAGATDYDALAAQLHAIKVTAGPLYDWFGNLLVSYADANGGMSIENKIVLMGAGDASVTAGDLRALLAAISHVNLRSPLRTAPAINDSLGNDPLDQPSQSSSETP